MNAADVLPILYRDECVVVVSKPAGLVVHRGIGDDPYPALQRVRDQIGAYVYPVHRLDRATSGVLLFALTSDFARVLQASFEASAVKKRYLALCRGRGEGEQVVDHPVADPETGVRREARTDLRWLGGAGRYGLVEARPITGRPHQIRKHLKHIACPIIGDVRYGKGEHNRHFRSTYGFHRLALHASSLRFPHPRDGHEIEAHAQLSEDFHAVIDALGLGDSIPRPAS